MNRTFNDCVILFGGASDERLVSVASAQNLAQKIPEAQLWFMDKAGAVYSITHEALEAHANPFTAEFIPGVSPLSASLKEALPALKAKNVILALHGTEGEDGKIQKIFEEASISFTGTGSVASARAFDKVETKRVAKAANLPIVEDLYLSTFSDDELTSLRIFLQKQKKIVLKPVSSGSSVGLYIVSTEEELDQAFPKMKSLNIPYMAETFISGREITVGVRQKPDGEISALPCSEVRVIQGRQFDYEGKYLGKGVEELTPAPLTEAEAEACQSLAIKTHEALGCRGYSRTDMMLTSSGPILLEINTLPGLSKASFIPQQLAANGEDLRNFFLEQINLA